MVSNREYIESLGFAQQADNILWSYDDEEFSLRSSAAQIFKEYPVCGSSPSAGSLFDESLRAARLIAEKHPRRTLLLSGGIDSEIMLQSFVRQNLAVKIVIIDYLGHNADDVALAKKTCDKLGVTYTLKKFDIFRFWENDLMAMAKTLHCTSPQVTALCQAASDLDGYILVGDGDTALRGRGRRFFETKSENWALARWMLLNKQEGCPRFFQYTKELEAAWYFEPLVEQFVVPGTWDFFDFRNLIYLKPFIAHKYFGCELRPKLTGFEKIYQCESYREKLTQSLSPVTEISWTYENAREWARERVPAWRISRLEESDLPELEKRELLQNGTRTHLIWRG